MDALGRWLIGAGASAIAIGLVLVAAARWGIPLGRLPGDIRVEREGFHLYFPIVTCLALSALLSILAWVVSRLR